MADITYDPTKGTPLPTVNTGDTLVLPGGGRYARTTGGFQFQGSYAPNTSSPTYVPPPPAAGSSGSPFNPPPSPQTPAGVPAPANPVIPATPTPNTPANQFPITDPAKAAADAKAAALANAQDTINSITSGYDKELAAELAAQAPINANNEGRVRALSALMGLSGSSSADTRQAKAEEASATQNTLISNKVNAQKQAALSAVYGRIDTVANDMYKAQIEKNAANQKAQLDATAKNALSTVQALAGQLAPAGKTFDDFKSASPNELQTLLDATGMTEYQLRQEWNKALPAQYQPTTTDWSISKDAQGNATMTRYTYDPLTKTNKPETYSTGLPYESVATGKLTELKNGDQVLMYPDGTYKMVKAYTPTELEKSQTAKNYADAQKAQEASTSQLSKTQYSRLEEAGVSNGLANQITSDILSGATLEDIRQAMRNNNVDPTVLDTYDRVVGIASLLKTVKPKTSGSSVFK